MATIEENLQELVKVTNDMKKAVVDKGVEVKENAGLKDLVLNIVEIPTGENLDTELTTQENIIADINADLDDFEFAEGAKIATCANIFSSSTLQTIDFSKVILNTSMCTSMMNMFYQAKQLEEAIINNLDTSSVTNCNSMFENCTNLVKVKLANLDFSKLKTINSMFKGCKNLKEIDMATIKTLNVTGISSMFQGCTVLEKIDIRSMTFDNVTNKSATFTSVPTTCQIIVNQNGYDFMTTNFPTYTNLVLIEGGEG